MTFKGWLKTRRKRDNFRGDLIGDILEDGRFPDTCDNWNAVDFYLRSRAGLGLSEEIISITEKLWLQYQKVRLQKGEQAPPNPGDATLVTLQPFSGSGDATIRHEITKLP